MEAFTEDSWLRFQKEFGLRSKADLVKHILTKHDGEARLVGDDDGWIPFPVSDGGTYPGVNTSIHQACFWHYQYATHPQVRLFLHQWSQDQWADQDLSSSDIEWMMERQGNDNTLLKWQWTLSSASGGWWIRKGNYITLAEMFYFGQRTVSAFDLYRAYVSLPTFIFKRHHSIPQTLLAQTRRNAKQ